MKRGSPRKADAGGGGAFYDRALEPERLSPSGGRLGERWSISRDSRNTSYSGVGLLNLRFTMGPYLLENNRQVVIIHLASAPDRRLGSRCDPKRYFARVLAKSAREQHAYTSHSFARLLQHL
jgi:hypothetical protein